MIESSPSRGKGSQLISPLDLSASYTKLCIYVLEVVSCLYMSFLMMNLHHFVINEMHHSCVPSPIVDFKLGTLLTRALATSFLCTEFGLSVNFTICTAKLCSISLLLYRPIIPFIKINISSAS